MSIRDHRTGRLVRTKPIRYRGKHQHKPVDPKRLSGINFTRLARGQING